MACLFAELRIITNISTNSLTMALLNSIMAMLCRNDVESVLTRVAMNITTELKKVAAGDARNSS